MPTTLIDVFEPKYDITANEISNMISAQGAKIRNLRLTVLDFLFDAELYASFAQITTLRLEAPWSIMKRRLEEKYGYPPNEALFTDQDVEDIKKAVAKSGPWQGQRYKTWRTDTMIEKIRSAIESVRPELDELVRMMDLFEKIISQNGLKGYNASAGITQGPAAEKQDEGETQTTS